MSIIESCKLMFGTLLAALFVSACSSKGSTMMPGGSETNAVSSVVDKENFKPLRISFSCTGDVTLRSKANRVLYTSSEFQDEWRGSTQGLGEVPSVNFTRSVVVAAHAGERSNCGTWIKITGVQETTDAIEIEVTSGEGCGGDDSIAYPVDFYELARSDKEYRFTDKTSLGCSPPNTD